MLAFFSIIFIDRCFILRVFHVFLFSISWWKDLTFFLIHYLSGKEDFLPHQVISLRPLSFRMLLHYQSQVLRRDLPPPYLLLAWNQELLLFLIFALLHFSRGDLKRFGVRVNGTLGSNDNRFSIEPFLDSLWREKLDVYQLWLLLLMLTSRCLYALLNSFLRVW